MGVFTDINQVLKKAVIDGAFASSTQIVFENNEDKADKSQQWLAVFILPAPAEQASLGGSGIGTDSHAGIMQIDINAPILAGVSGLMQKADEINSYLKSGAIFQLNETCVSISNVSVSRVFTGQGFATLPVTIEYFLQSMRV